MNKLLRASAAFLALAMASPALADEPVSYLGTVTLNTGVTAFGKVTVSVATPLPVTCATCGGSSGSLSATASATPTPVTAGTNKPLNIGLFSNLFETLVDSSGNVIDFSTPSAVTQSGTWTIGLNAAVSGGASSYSFEVAASDNHQVVKNGAGTLYTMDAFSVHTAALFVRLYDAGTGFNGCNSSTNLLWEGQIPGPGASGGGFVKSWGDIGKAFVNGLSVCATGAYGNTNTTAATASVASVNLGYK